MILQNPSALWGFLLLAIPIIVHLFDFRRIKRIEFSNVAFLQTIQKQNTPRRRLKDLLILLSRLLAFGFLILAFARPTVTSESNAFSAIDNLLVIDNTRSMASKCADFTCLEAAKMASIEVAKSFGQGQYFYNGAHRFRQFISSEELAQQLAPLEFSRENFSLDFERDILSRSQITIVSDFQPEVIDELLEVAADSIPILLIPIQSSADQNLYVDSVFLQNPFSIGDNIRTIAVEVANSGTNEAENVLIRIFNDRNQLSSAAVTIGANESRTVRFEIENSPNPIYRVEVEDYEMDFDNDYYFTIPRFEPIRIAVLGDKKNRPIEAIFENSEFFDLEVYSNSFIDFERFFSSDLVVVHSLDHLPEWFDIERMSGDLIVIPTATLDENNYSNRLGFRVTRTGDSTFSQLKMKGFEHPFFDGLFDELDSRTSFPKVRSIFKIGTGETLLVADRPYLQRIDQKSKIYWFSSPLEEDYSTLQNHALFLPIMYRIAENSKGYNEPIAYTLSDTPLQIALANTTNQLLELKGVNGQFVPSTYFNQSNLITTLPSELNDPGYYYLTAGSDTLKVIALNIDRMESVLNGENSSGLADHFKAYPNVRVVDANSVQSLEASLSELVTGKKLWKYALLLALMFLVAETALHRWLK